MKKALLLFCALAGLALLPACSIGAGGDKGEPYDEVFKKSSGWDDTQVLDPCVLYDSDDSLYKMYYSGSDVNMEYQIGYAESLDGKVWTRVNIGTNNICLPHGSNGTWNEKGVYGASVARVNATTWHMWFVGYDDNDDMQVGYASSADGKNWTPNAAPVLPPSGTVDDFDETDIVDVSVLLEGGTYHIWYAGQDNAGLYAIGYTSTATASADLTGTGTEVSGLGQVADSFRNGGLFAPTVIKDSADSKYKMWPSAFQIGGGDAPTLYSITYAESDSPDTGWSLPNGEVPVLWQHTTGFDVSLVSQCGVIENPAGGSFEMWYSGWAGYDIRIGYAESTDGIAWEKYRRP